MAEKQTEFFMKTDQLEKSYSSSADLPRSIQRILRVHAFSPRFEKLPVSISRSLMEWSSRLSNLRPNRQLQETLHRPQALAPISIRSWEEIGRKNPRPVVFYIHGGGWVLGSSRSHRSYCELIAEHAHCAVFSVDYRRAPEHPFPGPIEDVEQAWHWLQNFLLRRGWQDQPVAIAGDSAGANMATVLCRRLRDRREKLPTAQVLMYPVTDFAQDTVSYQKYGSGLILSKSLIDWFFKLYLNGYKQLDQEDLSPLHGRDLSGLPPAFVGLAGNDVLFDEGRAYARRLQEAGVAVTLRVYPDMLHAFVNLLRIPEARAATLESVRYLQDLFKTHAPTIEENNDA